jgi:hypothetical protein
MPKQANLRRWHDIYESYKHLHHIWMLQLYRAASLKNYDYYYDHDYKLANLS